MIHPSSRCCAWWSADARHRKVAHSYGVDLDLDASWMHCVAQDGLRHRRWVSDDHASDPGGHDLDCDHDRKDHEEHKTRLVPVEVGHCGLERHPESAAADEAEHGGFTHVDVPAERRD